MTLYVLKLLIFYLQNYLASTVCVEGPATLRLQYELVSEILGPLITIKLPIKKLDSEIINFLTALSDLSKQTN